MTQNSALRAFEYRLFEHRRLLHYLLVFQHFAQSLFALLAFEYRLFEHRRFLHHLLVFSIIDEGEIYREVEAKVGSGEFRAVDP